MEFKDQEDFKFLKRILVELNKQADRDITCFSTEIKRTEAEFDLVDPKTKEISDSITCRTTWTEVCWRPSRNSEHEMKHIDKIELNWNPAYGMIQLEIRGSSMVPQKSVTGQLMKRNGEHNHTANYHIGFGGGFRGENADIKKMFVRLFVKVKEYKEVEIPRIQREKFDNAVYEMFPYLLDEIFMENHDDNQEEDRDG